jgi:hypothetical protein
MELRTKSSEHDAPMPFGNPCAQCGRTILMPAWSEHVSERRIRHLWECDACGYTFETLVCFPEP